MKYFKSFFLAVPLGLLFAGACSSQQPNEPVDDRDEQEPGKNDGGAGGESSSDDQDSGECKKAQDCPSISTRPEACSVASCEAGKCVYQSEDADKDGFPTQRCQSLVPGTLVIVGDDCDDNDETVNPLGWDGPVTADLANGCGDGLDNDCTGTVDDGSLESGATCACTPDEIGPCSLTVTGATIEYPVLDGDGKPLGSCKIGSRTCLAHGTWGECDDAVGPTPETCDGADNDCDGATDEDAVDIRTFYYDGDGDLHSPHWHTPVEQCTAPTAAPEECLSEQDICPANAWASTPLPSDDCDDTNVLIHPGASERCNRLDDNCDTSSGSTVAVEPLEDEDGDGFAALSAACTGGPLPKTDCYDKNNSVRPNQTSRTATGYCTTTARPTWCGAADFRGCYASCSALPGEGVAAKFDYDCDEVNDAYDRFDLGGTTGNYEYACSGMGPSTCSSRMVPYLSSSTACGKLGTYRRCTGEQVTINGSVVWNCNPSSYSAYVTCK